jgi:hypothetical protein
VTDPSPEHNTTEAVYNDHGDVVREIRGFKDANGDTAYSVTVRQYAYAAGGMMSDLFSIFNADLLEPSANRAGVSRQNTLLRTREYAPFVVLASDDPSDRYTRQPAPCQCS